MIDKLIASLTQEERATLIARCLKNDSQVHKLLNALLENPSTGKEELQIRYGIKSNTYFKSLNLAKEEIFEVIKLHMRNAYDDMLLANVLYRRGQEVLASKLRLKLVAEYERYGWWSVLQEIYSMEMMVAYSRCDIKELEKQKNKILKNQERINTYARIDKELIVQMAIIEKGDLNQKEFARFDKKLTALMGEALQLGHHIPIFNARHTSYVFYTKYLLDSDKAGKIIRDTPKFLKKFDKQIIPFTRAVAWLNSVSFMVDFTSRQSPEPYFQHIEKAIGNHGLLYDAQAVLIFCFYYFLQKNTTEFDRSLNRFMDLPTDKSFHYKITFLHCLQSYLRNDAKEFNKHKNLFCTDVKSRAYKDYDLIIRYLEIILQLRLNENNLAADKLEAAIKFTRRNFTESRIKLEKWHWQMFSAAISGKPCNTKSSQVYSLTAFMFNELKPIN